MGRLPPKNKKPVSAEAGLSFGVVASSLNLIMTEFRSDRQQLIELLKQVLEIAQRLEHHSMAAIIEHWIYMLENNPKWWKDLNGGENGFDRD